MANAESTNDESDRSDDSGVRVEYISWTELSEYIGFRANVGLSLHDARTCEHREYVINERSGGVFALGIVEL